MKKEKKIKAHTRRTKSGKTITVKAHTAKYDAAEELKKAAKKKGAGEELASLKTPNSYEQYGFTKEEFAEWYEGTGSEADKKVEKALRRAMGSKAYDDLSDSAADSYKAGGADSFFKKGIKKMKVATNPSKTETSKKLKTQKTLNDYSDEDLDYAPKKDIKRVAKVLGLTDVEAASWVIGPNFTEYKESHMRKGEKKAKKYLGKEIFDRLDPSSPESFWAVLDKARGKKF